MDKNYEVALTACQQDMAKLQQDLAIEKQDLAEKLDTERKEVQSLLVQRDDLTIERQALLFKLRTLKGALLKIIKMSQPNTERWACANVADDALSLAKEDHT
jgi:hypothetical protein